MSDNEHPPPTPDDPSSTRSSNSPTPPIKKQPPRQSKNKPLAPAPPAAPQVPHPDNPSSSLSLPPPTTQRHDFPMNLYRCIESATKQNLTHLAHWSNCGKYFYLASEGNEIKEFIEPYFQHKRIDIVRRQLNTYGFERVTKLGDDWWERRKGNKFVFHRDRPDELVHVNTPYGYATAAASAAYNSSKKKEKAAAAVASDEEEEEESEEEEEESEPESSSSSDGKTPPHAEKFDFPFLLHQLIESGSEHQPEIVRWSKCGNYFYLQPDGDEIKSYMEPFFQHRRIDIVRRQLKTFGFARVPRLGEDWWERKGKTGHHLFHRDRPDDLVLVRPPGGPRRVNLPSPPQRASSSSQARPRRASNEPQRLTSPKKAPKPPTPKKKKEKETVKKSKPTLPASNSLDFPFLLYKLVQSVNKKHPDTIRWSKCGNYFYLPTEGEKAEDVKPLMEPIFQHRRVDIIRRQLLTYGFDQVPKLREGWWERKENRHNIFHRDRPNDIRQVIPIPRDEVLSRPSPAKRSRAEMLPAKKPPAKKKPVPAKKSKQVKPKPRRRSVSQQPPPPEKKRETAKKTQVKPRRRPVRQKPPPQEKEEKETVKPPPSSGDAESSSNFPRTDFPFLLYQFLESGSRSHPETVRWSECGNYFYISNQKDDVKSRMQPFFQHQKIEVLRRQLNVYGFQKVPKLGEGWWERKGGKNQHTLFHRDRPDDLLQVKPRRHRDDRKPPPQEEETDTAPYRRSTGSFPSILHNLIEEGNKNHPDIISWNNSGTAFNVQSHHPGLNKLLLSYFQHGKYDSLRRQLNAYGFKREFNGQYRNPKFRRGDFSECKMKKSKARSASRSHAASATGRARRRYESSDDEDDSTVSTLFDHDLSSYATLATDEMSFERLDTGREEEGSDIEEGQPEVDAALEENTPDFKVYQKVYARDERGLLYLAVVRRHLYGPLHHHNFNIGLFKSTAEAERIMESNRDQPMWHYFVHFHKWNVSHDQWVSENDVFEVNDETTAYAKRLDSESRQLEKELSKKGTKGKKSWQTYDRPQYWRRWRKLMDRINKEMGFRRGLFAVDGVDDNDETDSVPDQDDTDTKVAAEPSPKKKKDIWTEAALAIETRNRAIGLTVKRSQNQSINLPFSLKKIMVEQWELINQCGMMPCLPAPTTIRDALNKYLESKNITLAKVAEPGKSAPAALAASHADEKPSEAPVPASRIEEKPSEASVSEEKPSEAPVSTSCTEEKASEAPVSASGTEDKSSEAPVSEEKASEAPVSTSEQAVPLGEPKNPGEDKVEKEEPVDADKKQKTTVDRDQEWHDMTNGIAMLFDEALPANLLYREELPQLRVLDQSPGLAMKPFSEIYGCEHLLRLFTRLPEMLEEQIASSDAEIIAAKVNDFVRFLHKNHGTLLTQRHRKLNEIELKERQKIVKADERKRKVHAQNQEDSEPSSKKQRVATEVGHGQPL